MNYYLDCWKKSFVFAGRARRSEFWLFALFNALAAILLLVVDGLIGTGEVLYSLYVLASICANISVLVRRLHATDRSGWWYWIVLVPFVGAVPLQRVGLDNAKMVKTASGLFLDPFGEATGK